MTDPDLAELWRAWRVFGPWRLRAGQHRAQNVVQIVDTQAGGSFVLRVYQHQRDVRHIRYEHALVAQLQAVPLLFTVPSTVPTDSGETVVGVPTGNGVMFASLWPLVRGAAPETGNLEQIRGTGETLGMLDQALAQVVSPSSPDLTPPARHGDLGYLHPLVPDPMQAVGELPVDTESKARVMKLLENVLADVPHLYRTLPQQIIHGDYDGSNILMNGTNVVAVLDWEFSTHDLRALDLVVALHHWSAELRGSGREWTPIDALGRGYVRHGSLRAEERDALPAVWRLRLVRTLIHRIGRYRQGLDTSEHLIRRVASTRAVHDWLEHNEAALQRHAQRW